MEFPCIGASSQKDSEDTRARVAKRKALQRAKGALPNSPGKYVATVLSLIDTASPRKKRLFEASPSCSRQEEVGVHRLRAPSERQNISDRQSNPTCAIGGGEGDLLFAET